jgi:hypothetical protein
LPCICHILGQDVLNAVGAQGMASCIGKDRISFLPITFTEPRL